MANFADDIVSIEKLVKSISEKDKTIVDALEIAEVQQLKAHLHSAYLIMNRLNK